MILDSMNDIDLRIARTKLALDGLSVGDGLGGFFEFCHGRIPYRIRHRQPPSAPWRWTDDTQMALATVAVLKEFGFIHVDELIRELGRRYERGRGYGLSTAKLLRAYRKGALAHGLANEMFGGMGSFGNGSLARAALVGAFFADDVGQAIEQVQKSTRVTHAHPEAIAGGIAVAVAAGAGCRRGNGKKPSRADFFQQILPLVPDSQTKEGILNASALASAANVYDAVAALGNGQKVSTQDTLPFALWCVGEKIEHYEEAIWLTLNGLGDCDTTCAIVGGMVALANGRQAIPVEWLAAREPLDID